MDIADLKPAPLIHFQAELADKCGTENIVNSLNESLENPIKPDRLGRAFEGLWSQLERGLEKVPPLEVTSPQRATDDKIDELLQLLRDVSRAEVLQKDFVPSTLSFAFAHKSDTLPQKLEPSWHTVKREANAQLKAFLMPAQDNVDSSERVLRLTYGDKHKFHFAQMKARVKQLEALVKSLEFRVQ